MKRDTEEERKISYMQFGIRKDQQTYLRDLPFGTQAAFVRDAIDVAIAKRRASTKQRA